MYKEEPPSIHPDDEIAWRKANVWSIVTSTVISIAKLANERYMLRKL
ncbi:MAG: DUF4235 domain-containing protein [Balneolia bacterium]|nr:DUF4235 domain-containing protein [Balneolia bacterium]